MLSDDNRTADSFRDADRRFGSWISVLNKTAHAYHSARVEKLGLNPSRQQYLLAIHPDESVSQDELSRRLHIDKANVARAVAELERIGYVNRMPAPGDGRSKLVSLTSDGVSAAGRVESIFAAWMRGLRDGFTESQWSDAVEAIEKIARNALSMVDDSMRRQSKP